MPRPSIIARLLSLALLLLISATGSTSAAAQAGGQEAICDALFNDLFAECETGGGVCEENAVMTWFNCMEMCYYEHGAAWPECLPEPE